MRMRSLVGLGFTLFALLSAASVAAAQLCQVLPDTGQWAGPWTLQAMKGDGNGDPPNAEIAHAAVLPPPILAIGPDSELLAEDTRLGMERVVFMCRSACSDTPLSSNRSYIWKPNRPQVALRIDMPLPSGGVLGASDPFCSGHTFLGSGGFMVAGGLNYNAKCASTPACIQDAGGPDSNSPVGHRVAQLLVPDFDPPQWQGPSSGWPRLMQREHWYPTALTLHTGDGLVAGHFGAPTLHCPAPHLTWPYGATPEIDRLREVFSVASQTFTVETNRSPGAPLFCAAPQELVSVDSYPRMHILTTGELIHTNSKHVVPVSGEEPVSRVMNMTSPVCGPTDLRWEKLSTGLPPVMHRHGGSSVHLVLLDGPNEWRDVIYTLGGIDGSDAFPCNDPNEAQTISASVERLRDVDNDGFIVDEGWELMAPMSKRRVNHNTVILPTGELLVVGGVDETCSDIKQAAGFLPSEIFGGPPQGQWKNRASQDDARRYHSVAGLLPDGRVFSAGGNTYHSYHTVELFSPSYYFSGTRPEITTWPKPTVETWLYGDTKPVAVTVSCASPNTVTRLVMIRNASVTHGFDSNQRYVQLPYVLQGTYPSYTLQVTAPPDGTIAPPGYYLLFAIDSNGHPSEGRWVRIG